MSERKIYWASLDERDAADAEPRPEFVEKPEPESVTTRRTFLKAAGFSFAGLVASGCSRAPVEHAVPYARQPEDLTPGRAYLYASTCGGCEARCGVLVTTRDGRPVKIEGNPDHPLSGGATCAAGQASILGLYDSLRLAHPVGRGRRAAWIEIDTEITAALDRIRAQGGAVRILSASVTSPTKAALIAKFLSTLPDARHVTYDPVSVSAILDAHAQTHGLRSLPRYRFDRADVLVSFDADFLGTWISPVEFTRGYSARRRIEDERRPAMSYHVQIESRVSLTGSKADRRLRVAPGEVGHLVTRLAVALARRAGVPLAWQGLGASAADQVVEEIADRLWNARGRSLVIAGSQDIRAQALCNFINHLLDGYGATLDLDRPSYQRQGSDHDLEALREELTRGHVAALFIAGVNPVYDLPDANVLAADLRRVPLVVSFAERLDETARVAHYVCPDHHYLESWGDDEPVAGLVSLTQPTIHPLGETRSFVESLAAWMGAAQPALEAIRGHWERAIYPRAGDVGSFQTFWDRALERGLAEVAPRAPEAVSAAPPSRGAGDAPGASSFTATRLEPIVSPDAPPRDRLALVLYETVGMLDGRHAHNAWLHELPDPVTKVTWDNYACLSPAIARRLGVNDGDVVRVAAAGDRAPALEVPAFIQPGQHDEVVAIALGYGRAGTERFSQVGPMWIDARPRPGVIGVNAAPFIDSMDGTRRYAGRAVTVGPTGRAHPLASTQMHHSLAVPAIVRPPAGSTPRPIVQETTIDQVRARSSPHAPEPREDLWPNDHRYTGHRWGMAIDLNACTGCSACVIACQAENNVPIVGQDEVRRQREMHWIRIDRYYSGPEDEVEVAHQPMLCQQCEHAPCETVCPVLATVHSAEGLNEQIYNRCVGTRYCANNCPYKVRRFNWFDYPRADRLQNLALNPNVTVRSRGVMEKCTFCVQRIEETKIEARRTGQPLADGAVQTACQQVCPAQAIVFGDLNDPASRVARLSASGRAYRVLEELNTRPAVRYLQLVRQRPAEGRRDG